MKFILASASQRRKELLQRIIDDFDVVVSNIDEKKIPFKGNYSDYVMELASEKASAVARTIKDSAMVIGCDTIVVCKDKILGKPKDETDAFNMLKLLSGNIHKVYSGIAVIDTKTKNTKMDYLCTKVKFSHLTDDEIKNYIATGEPMDKAGAYGIQGLGGVFVEEINGDYYSVVGLPLNKLNKTLREMGVNL